MFSRFIKKFTAIALPVTLFITSAQSLAFDTITAAEKEVIAEKFANVRAEL